MTMDSQAAQPGQRLIRWPEVQRRVPFCRSQIYNLMAEGKFPRPIRGSDGGRASFWLESDIDEFIANRIAARNGVEDQPDDA